METTKLLHLANILRSMESVLVAFSGGVDSTFLLKVALDTLSERVLAVTAESPTFPAWQLREAKKLAKDMGAKLEFIRSEELANPKFVNNNEDRCYWCKKELFSQLLSLAKKQKINFVVDGSNADDKNDFRPGSKAAQELGIRSPLQEAGLTKAEIRVLSKQLGLPTWDKPTFACLSSRFPYKTKITENNLTRVAAAEDFLRQLGLRQVRVRHYDRTARIEVPAEEISKLTAEHLRPEVVKKFNHLGYLYVTVDLKGYRTGSLNEQLIGGGYEPHLS